MSTASALVDNTRKPFNGCRRDEPATPQVTIDRDGWAVAARDFC